MTSYSHHHLHQQQQHHRHHHGRKRSRTRKNCPLSYNARAVVVIITIIILGIVMYRYFKQYQKRNYNSTPTIGRNGLFSTNYADDRDKQNHSITSACKHLHGKRGDRAGNLNKFKDCVKNESIVADNILKNTDAKYKNRYFKNLKEVVGQDDNDMRKLMLMGKK